MKPASRSVRTRSQPERVVIMLLRRVAAALSDGTMAQSGLHKDWPDIALQAFADLVAAASGKDVAVLAPDAPYLGDGEIVLLALIAGAQREGIEPPMMQMPSLSIAVGACARALLSGHVRLPHSTTLGLGLDRSDQRVERDPAMIQRLAAAEPAMADEGAMPRHLKEQLVSALRRRGMMTARELRSLGVSRQYAHALCRARVIRRVRFGLYASFDAAAGGGQHVTVPDARLR